MRDSSPATRLTQAAVVAARGEPFRVEELTLSAPRPDEVVVELEACGICHADLLAQAGTLPFPAPCVLGHEGLGRVVELGAAVTELSRGDRVVMSFTFCGRCPACLDGRPAYCVHWPALNLVGGGRLDGSGSLSCGDQTVHSHFFGQSSFARHVATPARGAVRVPDDLPAQVLAPLGCGVQTGFGAALEVLRPRPGDRVAVFGAGAVGLSALMGLRLTGAAQVIAVDLHPNRLALARELGATEVIDARTDVAAAIAELTGGAGVNGAIETSGARSAFGAAIASLAASGTCVVIGVPPGGGAGAFDIIDLIARGLRIVGTNQGEANPRVAIPRLIELHRRGKLPVERMVTTFPFSAINEAAHASANGDAVKPVLIM